MPRAGSHNRGGEGAHWAWLAVKAELSEVRTRNAGDPDAGPPATTSTAASAPYHHGAAPGRGALIGRSGAVDGPLLTGITVTVSRVGARDRWPAPMPAGRLGDRIGGRRASTGAAVQPWVQTGARRDWSAARSDVTNAPFGIGSEWSAAPRERRYHFTGRCRQREIPLRPGRCRALPSLGPAPCYDGHHSREREQKDGTHESSWGVGMPDPTV